MTAGPLIVALDVPTLDEADDLAARLAGEVASFKVGLELFAAHGPEAVRRIGRHGAVFLDLKLHDIPHQVGRAARALRPLAPAMLTVHASGGADMVAAAVEGLDGAGLVLAVTVLTSLPAEPGEVVGRARLAVEAGARGLVCAPPDLPAVRAAVGQDVVLVTPGVRPDWAATDDHARAATPAEAIRDGADHLVVGRPITAAADPAAAARGVLDEVASAGRRPARNR